MIYYIESGQVKEILRSSEGKECLLSIHGAGDIFGELSLCGQQTRLDTVIAMEDAVITKMPCRAFLYMLKRDSLLEGMVQYLTDRLLEQKQLIGTLATANSEQRLAITLMRLAQKHGKYDPCGTRIEQRISHAELAEMVGTTRSRVCIFLNKWRDLGLIDVTEERWLIIREQKLKDYLSGNGAWEGSSNSIQRNDFLSDWPESGEQSPGEGNGQQGEPMRLIPQEVIRRDDTDIEQPNVASSHGPTAGNHAATRQKHCRHWNSYSPHFRHRIKRERGVA